jgi:hypothetical protein
MLIDEQGKMHSEGPSAGAAIRLVKEGMLRQINTMLQSSHLILVATSDGLKLWVEEVAKGQPPQQAQIVTGFEGDEHGSPGPVPVRRKRGTVEWGVVDDNGQIPIPKGYMIKETIAEGEERFLVFANPGMPDAPQFNVPEVDSSIVQFIIKK